MTRLPTLRAQRALWICGTALAAVFVVIALISPTFAFGTTQIDRPILLVVGLLTLAFFIYLAALAAALQMTDQRTCLWIVVGFAICFRVISLPAHPFQEIDAYRYVWDGNVCLAGVNPYRFSPAQVRQAQPDSPLADELAALVRLRDSRPGVADALERTHYSQLPTVYPPVSQAVFAVAAWMTPAQAPASTCVLVIKLCMTAFDLATMLAALALLRVCGMHTGWAVAYGWCPLVVKEFANSGHMDSIAVFFTTFALLVCIRLVRAPAGKRWSTVVAASLCGLFLALGFGAKLYCIVLVPLVSAVIVRRAGWHTAAISFAIFLLIASLAIWPMLATEPYADHRQRTQAAPENTLGVFIVKWQMNDFLFRLVNENTAPAESHLPDQQPWFVVVPSNWRLQMVNSFASVVNAITDQLHVQWQLTSHYRSGFLLARTLTTVVFLIIALTLACRRASAHDPRSVLVAAFLTLAWFWLLLPTQNPWYWTWALPLVCFAANRAWLWLAGAVMIYYLRFWFDYHFAATPVHPTTYVGARFFDFVVVWFEYLPWFIALAAVAVLRRQGCGAGNGTGSQLAAQAETAER